MKYLHDLLSRGTAQWPDIPVVIDGRGPFTYSQLSSAVAVLRSQILSVGSRAGMGIGIRTSNDREFLIALFAALGVGAVVLPLPPGGDDAEFTALAREIGLGGIIKAMNGSRHFHLLTQVEKPFVPHVPDAAVVRFTSGTTGRSKGVVLSHRSALARIEATRQAVQLEPGERITCALPMAFHFIASILLYVRSGATIVVCDESDPADILLASTRERSTLLYCSPHHLRMLIECVNPPALPDLRRVVSSSTFLTQSVADAFFHRFGVRVTQAYGIIEAGMPLWNDGDASVESLGMLSRSMTSGFSTLREMNFRGELRASSASVDREMFDGYLSPPRTRESVLRRGYFPTGDLAVRNADGSFTYRGRIQSMITFQGGEIIPEVIEEMVNAHPAVRSSRLRYVNGDARSGRLSLEVTTEPGLTVPEAELRSRCEPFLNVAQDELCIEFVAEIPHTATGKVARREEILSRALAE